MQDGDTRNQTEVAVFALVERSLALLGVPADPGKSRQLTELVMVLSRWAPRINLTGHRDPLEMTSRLVMDAVALALAVPELCRLSTVADLGSGAGFPGLPIAIMYPQLDVHLVDSRLKRNHFQREARRHVGLPRVHPILGRSTDLDPVVCDLVIAQAMTNPDQAFEWMIPWSRPGGWIVLPASEGSEEPAVPRSVTSLESRTYVVPEVETRRLLWVARVAKESAG